MGTRGNRPLLAQAMAPYTGAATSGQSYIPVPGGVVPGMNIVGVGGAWLAPGDFSDADGAGIALTVPMAAGTQWMVIAFSQNTSYVPVGGQLAPYRNKIINGNFTFWQRGTSLSAAVMQLFLADRWINNCNGSTIAPSRQAFTLGQTDVPGEPAYFHRSVVATSAGAGNYATLQQRIEGVRTLAGQTAMLSFWAKADAAKNIAFDLSQGFGTGGSPSSAVSAIGAQLCALTTAWKQFKVPVTIPSIAGKTLGSNGNDSLELTFWLDAGSTYATRSAGLGQQSGTFDIARVQLERGGVATDFEDRPIGTELMLCQRHYCKSYEIGTAPGTATNIGEISWGYMANNRPVHTVRFPVMMFAAPTLTIYNPNSGSAGTLRDYDSVADRSVTVAVQSAAGFGMYAATSASALGNVIAGHYTAQAEL